MKLENDEVWKDVIGYEGYYQVSNYGRVKSLDRVIQNVTRNKKIKYDKIKGRLLKAGPCNVGYPKVSLHKHKVEEQIHVHRLVALMFIENPNKYPNVNHKDANKLNNHVSNLEWVTQARNCEHAFDLNLNKHGIRHYKAKLTEEQVREIRYRLKTEKISQRKIAKEYNVSFTTIRKIFLRLHWRRLSD